MQPVLGKRLTGVSAARLTTRVSIFCVNYGRRPTTASAVPAQNSLMSAAAAVDDSSSSLWARIVEVYDRAQQTGAATKTDTKVLDEATIESLKTAVAEGDSLLTHITLQVHTCDDGGINFVLRIASALKSKPKGIADSKAPEPPPTGVSQQQQPVEQQQPPAAPFKNPFLPYDEQLWVQHLSDSHTLLLNKFNVVAHHVLVVTRKFESQQDPLNDKDLAAAQQVLAGMPHGGVAFYNCGEHSGRSQPHKHMQVVPLPFEQQQQQQHPSDGPAASPMDHVIAAAQAAAKLGPLQPFAVKQLPYRAYAVVFEQSTPADKLATACDQLLALCQIGLSHPVSYNVVMTRSSILMVPRKKEMCGNIAINSLGFAGTILLRSEADLEYALQQTPLKMLAEVGQPWDTEQQQQQQQNKTIESSL